MGVLTAIRGKVMAVQREEGDCVRYKVNCCDSKQVKVEDNGGERRRQCAGIECHGGYGSDGEAMPIGGMVDGVVMK